MAREKVCWYRERNLNDITEQIEKDAERMNMVVKQVSLSSYYAGNAVHQAIVIFEGEQNER